MGSKSVSKNRKKPDIQTTPKRPVDDIEKMSLEVTTLQVEATPSFPRILSPAPDVRAEELRILRQVYDTASRHGGVTFMAIDFETWEQNQDGILEVGYSILQFQTGGDRVERRETQHIVVKDLAHYRNGKFVPDARDLYNFGPSLRMSHKVVGYLMNALIANYSASEPLFLIFHDPRGDLKALQQLGVDVSAFHRRLSMLRRVVPSMSPLPPQIRAFIKKIPAGIYVVDTQRLYSAWEDKDRQVRLSTCCQTLDIATKALHNAGNDARYTLDLLESLMDRTRTFSTSRGTVS